MGKRWNLTDCWCLGLARDTAHWYAAEPEAKGWEFQGKGNVRRIPSIHDRAIATWDILF